MIGGCEIDIKLLQIEMYLPSIIFDVKVLKNESGHRRILPSAEDDIMLALNAAEFQVIYEASIRIDIRSE